MTLEHLCFLMIISDADLCLSERRALLSQLLDAVKQCQIRFGGRAELATDSDSRVACLCNRLEAVLCHGLKKNSKGLSAIRQVTEKVTGLSLKNSFDTEIAYWHFVKEFLNHHEYERYMLLKHITSDSGRGRAWLRSALNERSLEKYMHMMLADPPFMAQYYEEWAFLLDQERSSMLPMMSAGLGSILFAINIDDSNLNSPTRTSTPVINSSPVETECSCEPMPVITKDANNEVKKKERRKKKRGPDKIVSFDDEEEDQYENELESRSRGFVKKLKGTLQRSNISSFLLLRLTNNDRTEEEEVKKEILNSDIVRCQTAILPAPQGSISSTIQDHSNGKNESITDEISIIKNVSNENSINNKISQLVHNRKDLNPDGGLSDLSGEVSLTSSTSEDSSKCSTDRAVPTDLSYAVNIVNSNIPRQNSNCSISTQSSTNTTANHSSETTKTTLTPVTDTSVELILVSDDEQQTQSEDSVSIPSFTEDTDHAALALALTQKAVLSSSPGGGELGNILKQQQGLTSHESRSRSDTLSQLTETDLKQVVYTLLQKKDESEEQIRSLRHLLDQEMELSSSLRIQLEELIKLNEAKIEKEQCRIQALFRENEVLKHQLKKYVGAVQMLKRDTVQAHEVLCSTNDPQVPILPQNTPIDHEFEAMEYEKKLIQVAEMHGELMEFNERLHKTVILKENTIKRLKEELVDLRGPLPDDGQTSDEDIVSDASDNDTSSLSLSVRTLINIWIPSAFLTGHSNDTHHVYQVFIRIKDLEWNIYRRYSHFNILHQALRKKHKIVNTFNFPPKKAIGNRDAKLVEYRRQRLQHYLRRVINYVVQNTTELANNPSKDTLITLMPFFGEIPTEQKKSGKKLPASSSSIQNDQNLYTGL
ncbi:Sorting nexin-29 [Nymphon striatum]|nr:Sorting nexin-29 [Nymphon striatum]